MSTPRSTAGIRNTSLIGGLLLAFWMGWTFLALGRLQAAGWEPGDPREAELLLAQLQSRLPADAAGEPLAIRLDSACPCHTDTDPAWQSVASGMRASGGRSLRMEVSHNPGFEVLILNAGQRLVYAGPLQPDPAICGAGPPALRLQRWLPQLLNRTDTALVTTSDCNCARSPRTTDKEGFST